MNVKNMEKGHSRHACLYNDYAFHKSESIYG